MILGYATLSNAGYRFPMLGNIFTEDKNEVASLAAHDTLRSSDASMFPYIVAASTKSSAQCFGSKAGVTRTIETKASGRAVCSRADSAV